ncbi:site-specific integrase [Pseudomonas sp. LA21]|uniref:tyrosine-type recombinase/integrase n=1 Tax=Pseudomonas sp. LA21 TaxID=2893373 RepID=UPI001FB77D73|nr:site-specific integrase [Pseudomonas sp. LA21]MCJ1887408.1 site-specific integrase [Pseudomonas sp. LA21]
MSTINSINFSDAEIRRQAAGTVRELKDPRHQGLRLRFGAQRERGSWFLIVRRTWHRVGRWPDLSAKAMLEVLPSVVARLAADPGAQLGAGGLATVGDVLRWQLDRQLRNRNLSAKRKKSVKSMISRHLVPRLDKVRVAELTKALLDRDLFWPLQEEYSAGYVRQAYGVLVGALRQAHRVDQIAANPLAGMRFTDFVRAKIVPKAAGLRPAQLADLVPRLVAHYQRNPAEGMLALLMLCHGTRVGETRVARWRHISLPERAWIIPAEDTKTRTEHVLPLTDQAVALLEQYRAWQASRVGESAFLFPSGSTKALSEKQASDLFKVLGGGEWTSHDLRKLARTCWTELGVDHLIGEMLLNHAMKGVVAAYIQTAAQTRKREALELWHSHLDGHGFGAVLGQTDAGSREPVSSADANDGEASSDSSRPTEWRLNVAGGEGAE